MSEIYQNRALLVKFIETPVFFNDDFCNAKKNIWLKIGKAVSSFTTFFCLKNYWIFKFCCDMKGKHNEQDKTIILIYICCYNDCKYRSIKNVATYFYIAT